MRKWTNHALFALMIVGFVSLAYGLNYMYLSHDEMTTFGERIKFMTGDTMDGPVHSNDQIAIMGSPVFYDIVSTTADDFWRGAGYAPQFLGPQPYFNAPGVLIPSNADTLRLRAIQQGHYFNAGPNMQARVQIMGDSLRIWWGLIGLPLNTALHIYYPLPDSAIVYFNSPLTVFGTVSTVLILGAHGSIGLEDNIIYASADSLTGVAPAGHFEKFLLLSEGEIKILNTWANGRENSSGLGLSQTNANLTSIILDGIYVALGESFTFAQQNDPDSGYVCECSPDDRGTIYLYGSLYQMRRGYVHRGNRGSTGYKARYRYDNTLRFWNPGLWESFDYLVNPAQLDFGDVALSETVTDTIYFYGGFPLTLDSISTVSPFSCPTSIDSQQFHHQIPVSFTAADTGIFEDSLRFFISYYDLWMSVPLRAHVPSSSSVSDSSFILHPSTFILSCAPNPFNARTLIRFSVPQAGKVTLDLFDIGGRNVATILNTSLSSGEHAVPFDGAEQPSGIYFLRLSAANHQTATKLVLLK
jgi:hypothetical protein